MYSLKNIKVSIIVPNYNHSAYLKQRLDSIFAQSYDNYEVIILDDCSTDNSKQIIESYRNHKKVNKIIYNKVNSGSPFLQWQNGINEANGEWIWIAESDDFCSDSFLKTVLDNTKNCQNCVISYCKTQHVDLNGNNVLLPPFKETDKYMQGAKFVKKRLLCPCDIVNASSAIFKKEAALNISDSYTKYKVTGDKRFWVELSTKGNVAISSNVSNFFRCHDKNTSQKDDNIFNFFSEDNRTHNFIIKNNIIKKDGYYDFIARAYYCKWIERKTKSNLKFQNKLKKIWGYKPLMSAVPLFYGELRMQGLPAFLQSSYYYIKGKFSK